MKILGYSNLEIKILFLHRKKVIGHLEIPDYGYILLLIEDIHWNEARQKRFTLK